MQSQRVSVEEKIITMGYGIIKEIVKRMSARESLKISPPNRKTEYSVN
ncbi:unknown protein [Cronobacter turicensis z3032]|uniref:Uncharacterized protein n=1 Tax=Cronobacter turicensis (strain DSM 18703 / CCUG 55852 / LMG 23827 / z3032) TaxID=693216 RepID=C9XW06_CROTZ|nr:unknown protein [Cronobacter turicensis z3032]